MSAQSDHHQIDTQTPMIEVQNLSKQYGSVRAIEDISFTVNAGEVVGFLGPNGAGKTTTMRILCGCIGASSGTVKVDGMDVSERPIDVKKTIGYLPEAPPLYEVMTVRDYIVFAATIKGVESPEAAADRVILQVGLNEDVGGRPAAERIIGHLSKGYKQRVGLAQALVHEPQVLVLDEPTSGLDPAQRKEIQELLVEFARSSNRTVIISTHILAEVEQICDRVIMISEGSVTAEGSIAELQGATGTISLEVESPSDALHQALLNIDGVGNVQIESDHSYTIFCDTDIRPDIAKIASGHGLLRMQQKEGLEEIYLRLTGKKP
jgi:ABC-2 type transport system ATP-binding protein